MPTRSIDTAEALYRKLERSFHRRPAYGSDQLDWVFDTSVTAWHLVDWTALQRSQPLAAAQTSFKGKCPQLAVCEQVANGVKHLVLHNKNLHPFDVAKDVAATGDMSGISKMNVLPGGPPIDIALTTSVEITDRGGQRWDALQLFLAVMRFWAQELSVPPAPG